MARQDSRSGQGDPGLALRERIRLLVELGRPAEAVRLCHKARAAGDSGADLDELEGLALIRLGDPTNARVALGRGLERAPERPHLHYLMAFAVRDLGEVGAARLGLERALTLAPEEPVYLRAYAELLSDLGEHARATETARAAVRCGPDRAANHVTLGFVAAAAGDKALARASYEAALALDPEDAAAWNNLGCLDLEAGDLPAARQRFREALRLEPEGERAQRNLSQTLSGRTIDGFANYPLWLAALAEELGALDDLGLLIALALEAEGGERLLLAAARRPGRAQALLAVLGLSVGTVLGILRRLANPLWATAGLGLIASVGGPRLVAEARQRVRVGLATAGPAYEQIRADWIAGRIERSQRDNAARRLIEETVLALRGPRKDEP